jgi:hypothetical protein
MVEDLEKKCIVSDEQLNIRTEISIDKLNKIPKIHKNGKIVYCYCVHRGTSCFDSIRYKCNGYREYEVIKDE